MQLRTYAVKHYSEETKTVTVEEIYYFPYEQEMYHIINETYKNLLQNPELTIIASNGRLLKPAHKKKINLSLPAEPSKMLSLLSKFHLISSSKQDMMQWKKEREMRKKRNSSFHLKNSIYEKKRF